MTTTLIHVGIVGHRPGRLTRADPDVLRRVLLEILRDIRNEAVGLRGASGPRGLAVISPLAEGADRLFAELAFQEGHDLVCVMPFPQAEYENDFAGARALEPESLQRFRGLLARFAAAGRLQVTELAGDRRLEEQAYRAAGARVVELSDLLVAVWDGEQRGSMAGTDGAVAMARERGTPTVWVHAVAPHGWRISGPAGLPAAGGENAPWEDLRLAVRQVMARHAGNVGPS